MKPHTTHHDDCGCLSEKHRAEVDALRARVAEVEAERDKAAIRAHLVDVAAEHESAFNLTALAASQAEARELREALTQLIPEATRGRSCAHTWNAPCAACRASALLSRPHGDDTALREMLGRAINEAWWGKAYPEEANESSAVLRSHIVNRILGQPGDDAAPTKEE